MKRRTIETRRFSFLRRDNLTCPIERIFTEMYFIDLQNLP